MATIKETFELTDKVTPALTTIISSLQNTLNMMEKVDSTGNFDELADSIAKTKLKVDKLNEDLGKGAPQTEKTNNAIDRMDKYIKDNQKAQEEFNKSLDNSTTKAGGLMKKLAMVGVGVALKQLAQLGMKYSDAMTSSKARLDMINDSLQTTKQLQDMIYQSAERSRGSYLDTADAIGKMGIMAKDTFKSNGEIVAFMEQVNKQFAIAGTTDQGQKAAMLQLTQAMASGVLRGEELNSIFEQAPTIIQSIAKYLDVPIGQIRKMATEGEITAEIVKAAMFASADETNAKFETMPVTFAQAMTSMKNKVLFAMQDVLAQIALITSNPVFLRIVDILMFGIKVIAGGLLWIFDVASAVGTWIANNWEWIKYIMMFIATVALILMAQALIAMIPVIWGMVTSVVAMGVAWMMLNYPILLIALAIVGILTLLNYLGVTTNDVLGFVGGLFGVLFAFLYNSVAYFWNIIALVAEFLYNVFIDPVYAIKMLFYSLGQNVLDFAINGAEGIEGFARGGITALRSFVNFGIRGINRLIDTLNSFISAKLPDWLGGGTIGGKINHVSEIDADYTTGISDGLKSMKDAMVKPTTDKNVWTAPKMEQMDYGDAWNAGEAYGNKVGDKITSVLDSIKNPGTQAEDSAIDWAGLADGVGANPTGGKLDSVGKIDDSVELSDEDLKYLKDVAKAEFVNKFTTLRPDMKVTFGDVTETADVNKILDAIEIMVEGALATSLVG